ncbi:MAG: hypothetical protein RIM84_19000 [Alphaproteobacteria bacterium]
MIVQILTYAGAPATVQGLHVLRDALIERGDRSGGKAAATAPVED